MTEMEEIQEKTVRGNDIAGHAAVLYLLRSPDLIKMVHFCRFKTFCGLAIYLKDYFGCVLRTTSYLIRIVIIFAPIFDVSRVILSRAHRKHTADNNN